MAGSLLDPGPTLLRAEELRQQRGSRGLLEAVGTPLSYAPNPVVSAIGSGLLGARYLTGEKPPGEGLLNLSNMTAMMIGSQVPAPLRNVIKPGKYAIEHRPMADKGGAARLYDLTPAFGEDIYGKNAVQYFGGFDPREKEILRIMHKVRGNPNADVNIYRGIPYGVDGKINPGDWVTLSESVAKDYGPNVLKMKVKASDITSWADSLLEFGYFPK